MYLTEAVNGGEAMNDKFFTLPEEKQQAIINAGYRVFSQNSYKKQSCERNRGGCRYQ